MWRPSSCANPQTRSSDVTRTNRDPVRTYQFVMLAWAGVALACLAGLTVLVLVHAGHPFVADQLWLDWMLQSRSWVPIWWALALNRIGGGFVAIVVVPGVVILALVLWRRYWSAVYFAAVLALGAAAIQLVKHLVGRSRPGEMLVQSDLGSFPSGHAASAAVIAVVMCVLFARTWVVVVGALYIVAMMFSRTLLGVHWLSDTFAGVLLGAAVALVLAAALARPLLRERRGPDQPLDATL